MYEVFDKPDYLDYDLIDRAMHHACSVLDINKHIIIYFDEMEDFLCGHCDYEDDEIIITISDNLSIHEFVKTLFHELVHGKQFVDNEIDFTKSETVLYLDLPWEIEAFEMEQKLWSSWITKEGRKILYLVSYRLMDKKFGGTVVASSWEEAEEKIAHLDEGCVDGELLARYDAETGEREYYPGHMTKQFGTIKIGPDEYIQGYILDRWKENGHEKVRVRGIDGLYYTGKVEREND